MPQSSAPSFAPLSFSGDDTSGQPHIREPERLGDGRPRRSRLIAPLLLAAIGLAIFVGTAIAPPALLDDADSTHAEVAREIVESHDWVTLRMDGIKYYEKDPLMYWMIAGSFEVFGPTEFAARLPIALSAVLAIMAAWALGNRMFGDRTGFYSGLVFATCIGPFLFTRILIPDILLTALIAWALYFFLWGLESGRRPTCYLGFYVACGLAFLTKSMIGVVFPCGIVLLFLLATKRLARLKDMRPILGSILFLVIVVPWSVLAGMRNAHFLWFHYLNEQVYRYLGKRYPKDYDTVPLVLFYLLHGLWLFPWTIFLPAAVTYLPRRLRDLTRDQAMTLLLVVWIVLIIGFFSFSTRQEYYTLPAIPAFAILCGRVLSDLEGSAGRERSGQSPVRTFFRRSVVVGQWSLAGVGVAALTGAIVILVATRGVVLHGDISTALARNPEDYALSLGHIFDLTPTSFAALRGPVLGAGIALFLGAILSLVAFRVGRVKGSALILAGMMAGMFCLTHESLKVFEPYLSSKALAERVLRTLKPGETIVVNGEYESGSTLNFYSHQPLYMLNHRSSNLWYGSYLPGAPMRFYTNETFRQAWGGDRIYLDTDSSDVEAIRSLVAPGIAYKLYEGGGKVLLSNRP
ncbi:MAG TPA: glycosyltransferase family 39 protein [Blastocatellia bacterium]|nr:glycosyltransferase family 39 protein [Blastocatellia bacterium]